MKKVFLDANILLDFLDKNRKYHRESRNLISYLLSNDFKIVFSEDILTNIVYILRKDDVNKVLEVFREFIKSSLFEIVSFGYDTIDLACEYCIKNGGDFEDTLQYFCAKKENCELIYTMDKSFPNIDIPIKRYEDFIRRN